MRNWRTSFRFPYALALLAMAFAAWVALSQHPQDSFKTTTTTTAAVMDTKTQIRPALVRAAALIVAATNEFREEQGLKPVEINTKLVDASNDFADYMATTDTFSHTADGKTPSERVQEHGYDYCLVSENIAYLSGSAKFRTEELAEKMIEGWKKSPVHRANMLDPAVTESGVAVAHSGKTGTFYGVQMFGRPKSLSIGFAIDNRSGVAIKYTMGGRAYELPPSNRRTHQECLPADLTIQLSGDSKPQRNKYRPQNGNHFIISGPSNELRIEKN